MRVWCKAQRHSVASEYIEAGASASDDRRPVFQRMIAEAFVAALRERMLEKNRVFSKKYLKLLVEEIQYQNRQLVMKGSHAAVAKLVGRRPTGPLTGWSALF